MRKSKRRKHAPHRGLSWETSNVVNDRGRLTEGGGELRGNKESKTSSGIKGVEKRQPPKERGGDINK